MLYQAGGGGKGTRPIQQTQSQQQSQQHPNQIPSHHQTQSLLTSSNHQAHHLPSQVNNQQIHHGHQSQQHPNSSHLSSIQPALLPQPHHQQNALPHSHHHPTLPYYTYQLSQAPQPPSHSNQQQQVPNNGANASQSSNGNGQSSGSINGSNNNVRQHTGAGSGNMPTLYTPNTALLQSPATNTGFMTPYMQQYPIQTAVIAAANAAAQYSNNPQANGSNNNPSNNSQNNGVQQQSVYPMSSQGHQQQSLVQYFHPTAAGGPTPSAPPHLHPNQPQFRGLLTSGHTQRHNGPATYLLPGTSALFAMSSGQLTTNPSQRASLLPSPGSQTNGANGNIPMSQLMQAATNSGGPTTFMPGAFCTAPMGLTPGGLGGTSSLLTAGPSIGPSPLQTYGHLTNVAMSSSNTSMSSLTEGNAKPRKHAIPIIDPITHENILDPKPLQISASVEVKTTASEVTKNSSQNISASGLITKSVEADTKTSNTSLSSKWRDKSITVSIPTLKSQISNNKDKMDQQMQTEKNREQIIMTKIEDKGDISKTRDHKDIAQEGDAAGKKTDAKVHFPKSTAVGDSDEFSFKDHEDEKYIVHKEDISSASIISCTIVNSSTGIQQGSSNSNVKASNQLGSTEPSAKSANNNTIQSKPFSAHQQQDSSLKKPQNQSSNQEFVQQPTKSTPTTSGASSSTASTPTHKSQQTSTDTSTTPTPGNKRSRRNKRAKEQKKKTDSNSRNQQQQQLPQKQQSTTNLRNNSNLYCNDNNSNSGINNNTKNSRKGPVPLQQTNVGNNSKNNNNNNNNNAPAKATTNQTDNNNGNSCSETSCTTNVSSNHSHKKHLLNANNKQTQSGQQQPHQMRYSSNNTSSCSLSFGGVSSDAGSLSEAESKASIAGCGSVGLPDLRGNISSDTTTPSSSHLTSPKKVHRHIRAREIVAQYLTTSSATDSSSDRTNGSDETSFQFLNSSSSACEDEDENNARSNLPGQKVKVNKPTGPQQNPLEFGACGAAALTHIDEVYFGDFSTRNEFKKLTKTEENIELDVPITNIFDSRRPKKSVADTVDCVPMHATLNEYGSINNAHGSRKITILKNNGDSGIHTRQREFAAATRLPPTNTTCYIPQFYRYSLRELRELANSPEACKPPMVRCQKDNCVAQLFVSRQQHHLSSHQANTTLSAMALQHLQQYQQINYNESLEFVTGKRRNGGNSGGDRLKKHDHVNLSGIGNNMGMMSLMSNGSGGANSIGQQRKMDIIRVHLSLKEEIKLSECENAWTPQTLRGKATHHSSSSTSPNDDLEQVLKKVRGVLNKLTPDNFDVLLKTMTSISMNTQEKMQQVMLLIFEKTVSEPNFAPTYAKFCKVLFQEIKAESKSLFSTLLITRIQHEFETNVNDADAKKKKLQPLVDKLAACSDPKERGEVQAELEDQEYQFRRRAWGTVRFIGEMYKLQSLTSDRVLMCIESLLKHGSEEKLEFMCKLLTTVGYLLEAAPPEQAQHKARIDDIFRHMQEIVQRSRGSGGHKAVQTKMSSRVRFMIQDVIDLRARHWDQQTRSFNTGGTAVQSTTLQQMHQQRRKDEKSHGSNSSGLGSNMHDKQQCRGYNVSGSQSGHRQLRGAGNNNMQNDNNHYFMQKPPKLYSQQHHQQQEQKVNIDVNKLRFTRDEVTPSTTKLGSSSLYLWRTAGRASNSSLTTSASATSTQHLTLSAQTSSSSSLGGASTSDNVKRLSTNKFEVLDRISPTVQPMSDVEDAFNGGADDRMNSNRSSIQFSAKECQQLINRLMEEMFDVTSSDALWQEEALSVWCDASAKQQVDLLHYLLIDYLHLGSVKRQQREACAKIFKHLLVTPQVFDKVVFEDAYAQFVEEFPDLLVDVPDGWVYVFEFIGPILHANLLDFEDIWKPQWAEDKCFTERFVKAFINYFTHEFGANYTREIWHGRYRIDRGQQFMFDEDYWEHFVSHNRYDYLLETKPTENKESGEKAECVVRHGAIKKRCVVNVAEDERDPLKHSERIGKLLRQKNGPDLAMEYIISNVPINCEFLKGLTELFFCDIATSSNTAVATQKSVVGVGVGVGVGVDNNTFLITQRSNESIDIIRCMGKSPRRFELDIFRQKCLPVLRLCVDSNESLELSCLDAVFEIIFDKYDEYAANTIICAVFDLFYETELIPKETFEKWYQTQSLVDDAIEAAGTTNLTDAQKEKSSKNHSQKQSAPKKHSNRHKTLQNSNNPHRISVELHGYMRQLLLKMWCKSGGRKPLVQ